MTPTPARWSANTALDTEMKISLNYDTCVASGNCGYIAPKVFLNLEEHNGFVSLRTSAPPESEWIKVRKVARLCPSGTIFLTEEDTPGYTNSPD